MNRHAFRLTLLGLVAAAGLAPAEPPADSAEAHRRAGFPQEISIFAHPSDTGRYLGHYVGGGSVRTHKGDPPAVDEGTWGWDYTGGFFKRRVHLLWWHGRRYQGGTGAYRTDGPQLRHE